MMRKTFNNNSHRLLRVNELIKREISIFLHGLQLIIGRSRIPDKYIFKLLDIWPKFLRAGIMEIFEIIKAEKKNNKCVKAVIYTNNMGPRSWTLLIKRYIEKKLRYKLFDKVITAYRPRELTNHRTTHSKTYSDLIKSTGYGKDAKFLFLDRSNLDSSQLGWSPH